MARAYLDHASTSPARPEVVEAMLPWLSSADPARVHTEGRMARAAVEDARDKVAALLGARTREVVFTSSGTEAVNAAVWGAEERASEVSTTGAPPVMVAAAVEHSSVRDASARAGTVHVLAVDGLGRIDLDDLDATLERGSVALVHCQWGNHEVATLQPVADAVARCRRAGVLVHVDACQAAGHVPVDFVAIDADLLSVSAHKLGGPQGVGALLVRRGLRLASLLVGGDQERARRAGAENVAAIVGFGTAAATLQDGALDTEAAASRRQTERVLAAARAVDGVQAYGDVDMRLPHLVCLGIDGVEAEAVLLGLDQAGIAAHSGSACSSESLVPSPVLEAMGVDADRSLRLSVGWSTTDADIDAFVESFAPVVDRLRALAG
ncbi:MAG TPA: cysteine desulfurase family protein [Acidimicrobiales bacterium]|nr:cysteine desulfurase family protein [Acidimicrobiales bacterium]